MSAVSELQVIIPGACGPLAEVESIKNNPVLQRWIKTLSRTRAVASAESLHDVIKSVFGLSAEGDLPTAALTMSADRMFDRTLNYLHADPVHLRADLDHAVLTSSADLAIEADEAEQLCDALNQHFNQDGLSFYKRNNEQWILSTENSIEMSTTPLVDAIGRNVNFILPKGEASGRWKQILTEAQMLMHAHEVNMNRENAGQQSINSLWFHGSGKLPEITDSKISSVCSDHDLMKGLAGQIECDYFALPDSADEYLERLFTDETSGVEVLHISQLEHLINYTDVNIWLDSLTEVLENWLYPLVKSARNNRIKLSLYPCNGRGYQFSKYDDLKLWRQSSLTDHVKRY